ncbi:MAG: hypothetical protein LAT75_01905 [Candidatus Cyclonatronum sp.]|uniref:hypothetical protein n=1 Tax=Cyclonatronum sp. TaxID=3024185 RepID=UPI0025C18133|nr:hypothetical protein [Cyclonatronum sp.]MCH8485587.1 hypothetical protein [Cyclonatronum sp.]
MIHDFSADHIDDVTRVLDSVYKKIGDIYRFILYAENSEMKSVVEINMGVEHEGKQVNLVSVYAHNVFLQLHNCTGFVASDTLQQVTFFGKTGGQTTGLIIERNGSVNMYANVDDTLLSGDFTKLPPEIMMGSIALSLTESLDFEGFSFDE